MKAQSLSINTIIIAIIAVLVLVILVVILGTNIRNFTGNTDSCPNRGGKCTDDRSTGGTYELGTACPPPKYIRVRGTNCDDKTETRSDFDTGSDSGVPRSSKVAQVCCVPIVENEES